VVGYGHGETLYIFSHAYGGASGSGVFTENGKYIGYITAIDVGQTEWGIDVLENIVLVAPAFNVDWSAVLD
jgi:V8-like Glu-specific endopeptidase